MSDVFTHLLASLISSPICWRNFYSTYSDIWLQSHFILKHHSSAWLPLKRDIMTHQNYSISHIHASQQIKRLCNLQKPNKIYIWGHNGNIQRLQQFNGYVCGKIKWTLLGSLITKLAMQYAEDSMLVIIEKAKHSDDVTVKIQSWNKSNFRWRRTRKRSTLTGPRERHLSSNHPVPRTRSWVANKRLENIQNFVD